MLRINNVTRLLHIAIVKPNDACNANITSNISKSWWVVYKTVSHTFLWPDLVSWRFRCQINTWAISTIPQNAWTGENMQITQRKASQGIRTWTLLAVKWKKLNVFLPLEEANQSMLNLELDKKLCCLIVLYFTLIPHKLGFVWASSPLCYKSGFCQWKSSRISSMQQSGVFSKVEQSWDEPSQYTHVLFTKNMDLS